MKKSPLKQTIPDFKGTGNRLKRSMGQTVTGLSDERSADKIVSVGGNCHPLIAQQAEAFKQSVEATVAFYMKEAIKSDRTTLIAELEKQGHDDMANIIRSL